MTVEMRQSFYIMSFELMKRWSPNRKTDGWTELPGLVWLWIIRKTFICGRLLLIVCFMIVYKNEENRQFCLLIDLSAIWMERGNVKADISFCLLHEVKTEKPFCWVNQIARIKLGLFTAWQRFQWNVTYWSSLKGRECPSRDLTYKVTCSKYDFSFVICRW